MTTIPTDIDDPINNKILRVSEDQIQGFQPDPLGEVAKETGLDVDVVIERIVAMLKAGVIRRVRQTLLANNLAPGALIAWEVPTDELSDTFDWMFENDPFTGHVVIRSTDKECAGSGYRLWTTLKVPKPYSLEKHCDFLLKNSAAKKCLPLPAKALFALGVGHMRRRDIQPGDRSESTGRKIIPSVVDLTEKEWIVLMALKREFEAHELTVNLWEARAKETGLPVDEFYAIAKHLDERRVIGRFSTFLEHVKPSDKGKTVTRYNALFHWAVPKGQELEAGLEVGRHYIMTHGYWREGGPEFKDVNIMGVAHGTSKELVLEHKTAIDQHLEEAGIPVLYTNVFWGGRSEIKPSEISPIAYREWCVKMGIDPESMKA